MTRRARITLAIGALLAVLLVVATLAVLRARALRTQKEQETRATLLDFARPLLMAATRQRDPEAPSFDRYPQFCEFAENMLRRDWLRDAWGHKIIFRYPGPVHRCGWDLYSVGANGMDNAGEEDDILIGEDVAPVTTGR